MTKVEVVPEQGGLGLLAQLEQAGALGPLGLTLDDPTLSYERYEAIGALLGRMHQSLRFAIGDWLRLGEHLFDDRVYQAAEALGMSPDGMREYLRVAEKVPRSIRRKDLPWSTHRAVAALPPPEQKKWLREAAKSNLSHAELRDRLREGEPAVSPTRCRCCGRENDA